MLITITLLTMVDNPWKWVFVALVLVQHQHRYCKIFHQKYSKALEQSNQSHPPFSIPITSQCGCYFAPLHINTWNTGRPMLYVYVNLLFMLYNEQRPGVRALQK